MNGCWNQSVGEFGEKLADKTQMKNLVIDFRLGFLELLEEVFFILRSREGAHIIHDKPILEMGMILGKFVHLRKLKIFLSGYKNQISDAGFIELAKSIGNMPELSHLWLDFR